MVRTCCAGVDSNVCRQLQQHPGTLRFISSHLISSCLREVQAERNRRGLIRTEQYAAAVSYTATIVQYDRITGASHDRNKRPSRMSPVLNSPSVAGDMRAGFVQSTDN
jgi:hypothetical protein